MFLGCVSLRMHVMLQVGANHLKSNNFLFIGLQQKMFRFVLRYTAQKYKAYLFDGIYIFPQSEVYRYLKMCILPDLCCATASHSANFINTVFPNGKPNSNVHHL